MSKDYEKPTDDEIIDLDDAVYRSKKILGEIIEDDSLSQAERILATQTILFSELLVETVEQLKGIRGQLNSIRRFMRNP